MEFPSTVRVFAGALPRAALLAAHFSFARASNSKPVGRLVRFVAVLGDACAVAHCWHLANCRVLPAASSYAVCKFGFTLADKAERYALQF